VKSAVHVAPESVFTFTEIRTREYLRVLLRFKPFNGYLFRVILGRYIIWETLKTMLGVLAVLLLIYASNRFVRFLADASAGELSDHLIYQLLALKTLSARTIMLPMALFFSVLLTFGRLYQDHEMAVIYACGFSNGWLIGPGAEQLFGHRIRRAWHLAQKAKCISQLRAGTRNSGPRAARGIRSASGGVAMADFQTSVGGPASPAGGTIEPSQPREDRFGRLFVAIGATA